MMAVDVVVTADTGEGAAPSGEPEFPDVRLDRRFIVKRDGKDVVLYAGLLDLLHQLSGGFFDISTTLVQVPSPENEQTAICTARVLVFDPEDVNVVRRVASGIGDANPGNVTRMMAPHLIRMSETRAKARALRDCVNVGMVSLEELGGDDAPAVMQNARQSASSPQKGTGTAPATGAPSAPSWGTPVSLAAPVDFIEVGGRRWSAAEVDAVVQQRLVEAARAGIDLPEPLPTPVSRLSEKVGWSQSVRKRLEAAGAARSSGK
jgi:hypothetical protein